MLSNLASYLGYSSAPVDRSPPATVTADVRLRDEEDDWVLIESNERDGGAQASEIDDEPGITRVTLAISTCPATLPGASKNLSRSVSLDISCPLQESWYLTPPPSFTSEGPVHMETSPLENMLIEHPSMSVYEHTSRRNSSTPSASPCEEEPSLRPPSPSRVPRKDKLNKVPRNKINTKFSKKLTAKRANDDGTCESEEKTLEAKEPKIKNFIKSPRRSVNSTQSQRVPNISRSEPFDEMISGSEKCESGASAEVQVVPTRKLYSEVLASKPKPPPAQEPPTPEPVPEAKEQEVPESVSAPAAGEAAAAESESVMSVEETPEEGATEERTDMDSDRRREVLTIVDHQQRQKLLTRSAQKVEQRKTCDLMKRNPLIRTNKAREINFRNKRQRRADMMQRHSGANNNRKC